MPRSSDVWAGFGRRPSLPATSGQPAARLRSSRAGWRCSGPRTFGSSAGLRALRDDKTDQPTVARIESGSRAVSIDELFVLAAVLDVPPVDLLTPLEDEAKVQVGKLRVPVPFARAWIRGDTLLPGGDLDARYKRRAREMPESELRKLVRPDVYRRMTRDLTGLRRHFTDMHRLNEQVDRITDEIVDGLRNPKEE
jgi:transcriptional regulator with XRE-family HTH domain